MKIVFNDYFKALGITLIVAGLSNVDMNANIDFMGFFAIIVSLLGFFFYAFSTQIGRKK